MKAVILCICGERVRVFINQERECACGAIVRTDGKKAYVLIPEKDLNERKAKNKPVTRVQPMLLRWGS